MLKKRQEIFQDENIISKISLHWIVFFPVFLGIGGLIGLHLIADYLNVKDVFKHNKIYFDAILFFIMVGIPAIISIIRHISTELIITNKRIILNKGIINIDKASMPMNKIENIDLKQNIIERIIKAGWVRVSGSGGSTLEVGPISKPNKYTQLIFKTTQKYKNDQK